MSLSEDVVRLKMRIFFREHYEELILTKRIEDKLMPIIMDGIDKHEEKLTPEQLDSVFEDFFSMDRCLSFVVERQPNTKDIPNDVILSITDYFHGELKNYQLLSVYRKSNHLEDEHLYMVKARHINGEYACWTSWNQKSETLYYGHYNLSSDKDCMDILKEQFNDITDEPNKYGFNAIKYDFPLEAAKEHNEHPADVISIRPRRLGR